MAGRKRRPPRPPRARWVDLLAIASVGFVVVLVAAWLRLPDVERGVVTLVDDLSERMDW